MTTGVARQWQQQRIFVMGGKEFFLSLIRELTDGSIRRPPVDNCLVTLPTDKSLAKSPL